MAVVGETEISLLINTRTKELRITRSELATRCGFKNAAKGVRRLDHVCGGDFSRAGFFLSKLPDALSLAPRVVEAAILATRRAKAHEQAQSYRDAFRPRAIIVCERSIPEPIWMAAVIGVDRILRIDFKDNTAPIRYVRQALDGLDRRLRDWQSSALPAFGRPKSIVVNYAYDKAIEFDLEGNPLRRFDAAVRTGESTIALSGHSVAPTELARLIGV